jgi:phosphohistidine phosphatase SixA/ADP-ribose pyrophosphatase YjhB (NUDIX family)
MRIPAAGTLPWRDRDGALEVALVHRPRYDDWSWAKGKLDPDEEWPVAAVRETDEETGLRVALGVPLPEARYTLLGRDGSPDDKVVRYWAARVVGGSGKLMNEIDDVAWLDAKAAHDRLDYARDQDQLLAMVRWHQSGLLATWPLVLVRHAHAVARGEYSGKDDTARPLDGPGRDRARVLVDVLGAYGPTRVLTSPSVRCRATVQPFADASGAGLRTRRGLSEEGYEADPTRSLRHLDRLLDRAEPAVLCSHGPVLPGLVEQLEARVHPDGDPATGELLDAAREDKLAKGEALVCHLVGAGPDARVVAVERYLP